MKNLHSQPAFDASERFVYQQSGPGANSENNIDTKEAAQEAKNDIADQNYKDTRQFLIDNPAAAANYIPGLEALQAEIRVMVEEGDLTGKATTEEEGLLSSKAKTTKEIQEERAVKYAEFAAKTDALTAQQDATQKEMEKPIETVMTELHEAINTSGLNEKTYATEIKQIEADYEIGSPEAIARAVDTKLKLLANYKAVPPVLIAGK